MEKFIRLTSRSISLVSIFLFALSLFAGCKKEVTFETNDETSLRYFEGGPTDQVENVSVTRDDGFLYYGSTKGSQRDGFLMKVDKNGVVQWYKTYGGKHQDKISHAIQTSDGGYIAVGESNSLGFGGNDSITALFDFIVKVNANGEEEWKRSIFSLESQSSYVYEDGNGDFCVAGSIEIQFSRIVIVKFDKSGNIIRGVGYTRLENIPPNYIQKYYRAFGTFIMQENNELLIGGVMSKSGLSTEARNYVSYIMKVTLDSLVATALYPFYQWDRGQIYRAVTWRYNVTRIIPQSDGYILATDIEDPVTKVMSIQIIKSDFGGNLVWEKRYPGLNNSIFRNIYEQNDGSLLMVGASSKEILNPIFPLCFSYLKMMICKLTANGDVIWTKYYGSEENVHVAMAASTAQNGLIKIAGATNINATGYDRMNMIYLDSEGNLVKSLTP